MKLKLLVALTAHMYALCTLAAHAHHSFVATYQVDKEVQIEGTVVNLLVRNPHSFLHLMVEDETGELNRWSVEWGALLMLNRLGINPETIKPGDWVVIRGSPGHDAGDFRLRMTQITRPSDGWSWGGTFD